MLEVKEKQLLRLLEISKQFIDSNARELSCQQVSDYMLELSGAKYVAFNVYDCNEKESTTVALSGVQEHIKKAVEILGFKIVGKSWDTKPSELCKTKGEDIKIYEKLERISNLTNI